MPKTVVANLTELGERLDPPVTRTQAGRYAKRGMPGLSGHYVVEDCQAWVDRQVKHRGEGKPRAEQDEDEEPESPQNLERYRAVRVSLAELELAERMNQLIPRDALRQGLASIATILRRTVEQLERQFGRDAADLVVVALDDCDREIRGLFDDPDDTPASPAA